jgi:molybdopterin-guanine dinucleotide biosynthesis protein A
VRGAVLAGGAAQRYGGEPKGLSLVGGRRILDRVVDAVALAVGQPPLLVANAPHAGRWRPDLRVIPDQPHAAGAGSIAGIYTAVCAGSGPVLCVAWDMPFVDAGLLGALIDALGDADACLPESGGRRGVEPLCAVYAPACGPAIERQLARGDHRAVGFHGDARMRTLSLQRVQRFGDPEELFFNVNTPDDLIRAEELWRRRA